MKATILTLTCLVSAFVSPLFGGEAETQETIERGIADLVAASRAAKPEEFKSSAKVDNEVWRKAREAYFSLMKLEGPGWKALVELEYSLSKDGDATRSIGSFFQVEALHADLMKGLNRLRMDEHAKRAAANETWALLHAQNLLRSMQSSILEEYTRSHSVIRYLKRLDRTREDPAGALFSISLLRVLLVGDASFPGHTHPWDGGADEQRASIRQILEWGEKNSSRFPYP